MIEHVPCGHGGGLLTRNPAESGVRGYPPFAVLQPIIRNHFCRRRLRECRTAKGKREAEKNWQGGFHCCERLRFVARLLDGEAMTEVCREFGISRKPGYKSFDRYKEHGLQALPIA
jgi:Helix-turn-helix domain